MVCGTHDVGVDFAEGLHGEELRLRREVLTGVDASEEERRQRRHRQHNL